MSVARMRDIGAFIGAALGFTQTAVTAAGAGDATEIDGDTIDRLALGDTYEGACLIVACRATQDTGETLTIAANWQDSPNDSDWTDLGTAVAATTVITAAGTSEQTGTLKVPVNLDAADRYVRVQVTPDLSRAGTDTATVVGLVVFGGGRELAPAVVETQA